MGTIAFFYDLEYRYDQVGNRTEKIDHLNNVSTAYIYDVEDRATYGSNSNRLMTYRVTDNDTGAFEDVWYYYDVNGNVLRIVRLADGAGQYESTGFVYNKGGMVEYVVGETWNAIGEVEWHEGPGSLWEYALTPEPMTWAGARAYAQSRGGDLIVVYGGWFDWLAETFGPASGTVSYWVGALQDPQGAEPSGGWEWVNDPEPGPEFYWLDGQPDDGGYPPGYDHDVAAWVMDADTNGWDDGLEDAEASELRYGIIERPPTAACDPDAGDVLRNQRRTFAWQFRYETARGRYMRRMLDPETLDPVVTEWSQYDGDWVHADFEVVDAGGGSYEARTTRHYFGAGHADVDASGDWTDQAIAFGNQIGSTELLVDADAQVVQDWAYTAFGEPADLDGPGGPGGPGVGQSRYGYAGDWGYETNSEWPIPNGEFPFLHVGYRWYDPGTGRFLQRDPIGISGGLNVYAYVGNEPATSVDPHGQDIWIGGAQPGEPRFHLALCVGNPYGFYTAYSFGLTSRWWLLSPYKPGMIYSYTGRRYSAIDWSTHVQTSRGEDRTLTSVLDSMVGKRMNYGLTYGNCRQFVKHAYDWILQYLRRTRGGSLGGGGASW